MQGLLERPAGDGLETLRNGWLHTGDVGHMDEDDYLYITDRLKDMIIKGGTNIYPREIEEVLYAPPRCSRGDGVRHSGPEVGRVDHCRGRAHDGAGGDGGKHWAMVRRAPVRFKKPQQVSLRRSSSPRAATARS